jgi:hypothetical protein
MRLFVATSVLISTLVIGLHPVGAAPGDLRIRWDNVVGIMQAGNVVGGVTGGGQPWITEQGAAEIDLSTSRLMFSVKGLVLMGGNSIGTRGGIDQVRGTLVCDVGGSPVLVDTGLVPLSPQGDADFAGDVALDPLCVSSPNIAFLIRTAGGAWIAAGAVRVGP